MDNAAAEGKPKPNEHLLHLLTPHLILPQDVRRRLSRRLRTLRHAREDADYRPRIIVNRALALHCHRDAIVVCRRWGYTMLKTKQPNKQTIAEAVRKYIKEQRPGGATFEVRAPGIRKERHWWHVPVRPSAEPVKRYKYYEALADHENLTIFLVPLSPEEPSSTA
jgi:hypothetical protein